MQRASGRTIVIDGDSAVLDSLITLLDLDDHAVETYGLAEAFLQVLDQGHIARIACEVDLPDGSGIEVIRRVRAAYPDARCALLASRKDRNISQLAAAAGAEVVFYKPLIQRSLLEFLTGANACACY